MSSNLGSKGKSANSRDLGERHVIDDFFDLRDSVKEGKEMRNE